MRKYIIGLTIIVAIVVLLLFMPAKADYESSDNTSSSNHEYYYNEDDESEDSLLPNDITSLQDDSGAVPLNTIPSSLQALVNRRYLLPATYIPANLVAPNVPFTFSFVADKRKLRDIAATALEKMFAAAKKDGYVLYGVSGYRSYVRQTQIYENNVRTRGSKETDSVSAMPGSSEHQTGLAIDISAKSVNCQLDQALGKTKEGKWIASHSHLYGYIIRYPKGKNKITGYTYEPWHIRYVGVEVATYLYQNNLTLEEYYGCGELTTNTDNTGVDVEDADKVKYATPSPTKKSTPKPSATPSSKSTAAPKKTAKPNKNSGKATATPKTADETTAHTPVPTHPPTTAPTPVSTEKPVHTESPATQAPEPTSSAHSVG